MTAGRRLLFKNYRCDVNWFSVHAGGTPGTGHLLSQRQYIGATEGAAYLRSVTFKAHLRHMTGVLIVYMAVLPYVFLSLVPVHP